jgi:hypothetical protein
MYTKCTPLGMPANLLLLGCNMCCRLLNTDTNNMFFFTHEHQVLSFSVCLQPSLATTRAHGICSVNISQFNYVYRCACTAIIRAGISEWGFQHDYGVASSSTSHLYHILLRPECDVVLHYKGHSGRWCQFLIMYD